MTGSGTRPLERLAALLDEWPHPLPHHPEALLRSLQRLCNEGLDQLPPPGGGQTLQRWQALATVAAQDLSLCKLYEGHTDALAIFQHYETPVPAQSTWGMWAAEPPQARVTLDAERRDGSVRLHGRKAWCSGATVLSHGLLTAWNAHGEQQLVAVALEQPGVRVSEDGWQAVGMAATQSVEILFEDAIGQPVGPANGYLARPGFWQGGAGIAACLVRGGEPPRRCAAQPLRRTVTSPMPTPTWARWDCALSAAASALRDCAAWIDANPEADAELPVRRVRAIVEHSASAVIEHVGRALGAAPYCRDAASARLLADLPVFFSAPEPCRARPGGPRRAGGRFKHERAGCYEHQPDSGPGHLTASLEKPRAVWPRWPISSARNWCPKAAVR